MCIVQLNKGDAVDEDNCKMRIDVTLSQTDHQEGINDNKVQFNDIFLHFFIRIIGNSATS